MDIVNNVLLGPNSGFNMVTSGGPVGGGALLPGSVLQDRLQPGVAGLSAYPLKLAGARDRR